MTLLYAFGLTPIGLIYQLRAKTFIAIPLCLLAVGFQYGLGDSIIFGEYNVGGTLCDALVVLLLSLAFVVRQLNVYKVGSNVLSSLCLSLLTGKRGTNNPSPLPVRLGAPRQPQGAPVVHEGDLRGVERRDQPHRVSLLRPGGQHEMPELLHLCGEPGVPF